MKPFDESLSSIKIEKTRFTNKNIIFYLGGKNWGGRAGSELLTGVALLRI